MPGVGPDTATDLTIANLGPIQTDVCKALNKQLTGSETIPVLNNNVDSFPFAGVATTGGDTFVGNLNRGQNVLCFQHTSPPNPTQYGLYAVLHPL